MKSTVNIIRTELEQTSATHCSSNELTENEKEKTDWTHNLRLSFGSKNTFNPIAAGSQHGNGPKVHQNPTHRYSFVRSFKWIPMW